MATRYWVGGDGSWSDAENHWSNTSGGTPNIAYLPSSDDNVIFDANSNVGTNTFGVTVDGISTNPSLCKNFTASSLDGLMTLFLDSTSYLDCYGSMTLPATNFTWFALAGGTLEFPSTSTGNTITTNGVPLQGTLVVFNGVGGEWTLGSALTIGSGIYPNYGTFNTANYNISTTGMVRNQSANAATINLGSSVITCNTATPVSLLSTNLTFNAGTSTFICTNASPTFGGAGLTFYNVTFSGGAGSKTVNGANTFNGQFLVSNAAATVFNFGANQNFAGGALIQATNPSIFGLTYSYTGTINFASAAHGTKSLNNNQTFQNVTITCPAVDGITTLNLTAPSVVITGTLTTTNGGSTSRRVQIVSNIVGTQRTFTVGTNSLINTDFRDIIAAGTASWVFGPGYGDLGNNSGITFNSSALYWIGGSGNWSDGTKWSTSSGGSAANAIPMQQNSVVFDQNSNVGTGTFTVTVDGTSAAPSLCNDFSTSSLDGTMTLTMGATAELDCYGSMTLPATNFIVSGTVGAFLTFAATTTGKTLTTNGVGLSSVNCQFDGVGGGWTLGSAFTSVNNINVLNGSFSSGNFNITTLNWTSSNSNTRSITLGSSTVTVSGTAPINFATTTGLTFSAGTSTINCSNASPTFAGGGLTYNNVGFTSTAIGTVTITGSNTFNNLSFTARAAAGIGTVNLDSGGTNTVNGTLTLGSGTSGVQRLLVRAGANPSPASTLSVATLAAMTDVDFRDITAAGTASPFSGTRIGNCLGNTNITFTAARTVYWNLAAGGSWSAAAWATSSGGTAATTNFPLAQDSIVIENTGLNTSSTITMNASWQVPSISFATRSNAATFATGTTNPTFYGDFTLSSAITLTGTTGTLNFADQGGTATITSAGVSFPQPIAMLASSGTLRINGNLTIDSARTFTLTAGTLDLTNNGAGNFTLSTGIFSSSNTNTRSITFGTGNITVTGNAATIWNAGTTTGFTYTGTPTVNATYAGSTGTRTLSMNSTGGTESNVLNFNISAGSDIVTINTNSQLKNLNFTGFSGTLTSAVRTIYGNLTFSATMTCTAGTNATTFAATSGTQQITTNGNSTIDFPITQNGVGGTVQLQDNLTIGSTRTYTLTNGTLDLTGNSGNWTLSTGLFSSSNSNTRSILFGTGNITLTGNNATILTLTTPTGLSYTGTPVFNATYSGSTGTRAFATPQITAGAVAANAVTVNISAGSDTVSLATTERVYLDVNFTGFSGTYSNSAPRIFGNLTMSSGMTVSSGVFITTFAATSGTKIITTAGKTLNFPLVFDGVGGTFAFQDALTQGSTSAFTITNGTVQLKASTTNVVGSFVTNGTGTKALQSTIPGTQATISEASGDVYADNITITDSAATGGANFYATAASNGGNNTGWNFGVNFYYWVGGTGNWSDAANHWSNSSGGSPSASYLPTQNDIVLFDANSNSGTSSFIVTVDGTSNTPSLCNDFVINGTGGGALDGAMTLSLGATSQLDCYGSLTLPATNFTWTGVSGANLYFQATTTGKTITTNGVSFSVTEIYFAGVGGGWTLGSAIASSGTLVFQSGTFNTGNYNVTTSNMNLSGSLTRTVNLGSSTLTFNSSSALAANLTTNLTFNAGTSQINCSGATTTFAGGGLTFYNVSFTSAANGTCTITGANTYNNLIFTSRSANGIRAIVLGANQTVSGALIVGTANTAVRRPRITSDTVGSTRTITLNGVLSTLADVDFRDITAAGTYGTWSGTRLGDGLGNSNITFVSPKTVYWNLAGTQNWSATAWATTNNGTPNANNFPLAQDTAVFTEAGAAGDITMDANWFVGTIQMADGVSNRTTPFTFANSGTFTCYGNITLFSGLVWSSGTLLSFFGQGKTNTFTSAGVTVATDLTLLAPSGTLRINGNLTILSTEIFTLSQGALDLTNNGAGNYVLSTGAFLSTNSNTRSIAFGTGNITVTGPSGTVFNTDNSTNFTVTGTAVVNVTANETVGTFKFVDVANAANSPNAETNAISVNVLGGTQEMRLYGTQLKNVDFTGFSGNWSEFGAATLYGNLTLSSTMTFPVGTNPATYIIFRKSNGTQTATFNGVTVDRPILVDGFNGTVAFQDALTQTTGRSFDFNLGTLQLKSGTTNTVGVFATNGATLKYLAATTVGSQATITTADTNQVYATYLSVKDSNATPAGFWYALTGTGNALSNNCINAGNNSGWNFIPSGAGFIPFF
jgi:hypothetical protein